MSQPSSDRFPARWLLCGLVVAVLGTDVLAFLLGLPNEGGSTLRLLLAVGAVVTVPAGVALGVARRPVYLIASLLASPVAAVYAVTGLLLPWDQVAFSVGQSALETLLVVPAVGDDLAVALFGGTTLSRESLRLAVRYHYTVVAVGVVALAVVVVRSRWSDTRGV